MSSLLLCLFFHSTHRSSSVGELCALYTTPPPPKKQNPHSKQYNTKKKSNKHIQPIEEEQRPLVLGKGRLPDEAPADAGVQLKPVTLITPPEEVYTVFTEKTIYI